MSTKVTFKVTDEDMEYARSIWDSADYVLSEVVSILNLMLTTAMKMNISKSTGMKNIQIIIVV